ncbi:MAG: hypothetical protein AAF558_08175 [Verrucomicrobiota bacterium]
MPSKINRRYKVHPRKKGYLLLEVILALGVFAVAFAGIAKGLNGMIDVLVEVRKESAARTVLQNHIAKVRADPIEPKETTEKEEGFVIRTRIEPMDLRNEDDEPLQNLFKVIIEVSPDRQGAPISQSTELVLYRSTQ